MIQFIGLVFLAFCGVGLCDFEQRDDVYFGMAPQDEYSLFTYKSQRQKMSLAYCEQWCAKVRECAGYSWHQDSGCTWWRSVNVENAERRQGWISGTYRPSASECQQQAVLTPVTPCLNYSTRWTFEDGRCQTFRYSGCLGGRNNFKTLQECQRKCLRRAQRI